MIKANTIEELRHSRYTCQAKDCTVSTYVSKKVSVTFAEKALHKAKWRGSLLKDEPPYLRDDRSAARLFCRHSYKEAQFNLTIEKLGRKRA